MEVSWQDLKSFVQARELRIKWIDLKETYFLKASDGDFELFTALYKLQDDQTDIEDFEQNFKTDYVPG